MVCFVLAFSFVSCDKSSSASSEIEETGIPVNYTVFLSKNNQLSALELSALNGELTVNGELSTFANIPSTYKKFRTSNDISFYYTSNCKGYIQWYNVISNEAMLLEMFNDIEPCAIQITSIAHTDKYVMISYEMDLPGKDSQKVVRIYSKNETSEPYIELILDKKPIDLISSANRLFVLTLNEFVTDEFHLSVFDLSTNEELIELDLGVNAKKLFKNGLEQIIISYPEFHTIIDPVSLDKTYTTYGENSEPNFTTTKDSFLDITGKMYFQKAILDAEIDMVPAIYDFQTNNTVVYLFENFLSESEINVKYNIGSTSAIAHDDNNKYMLIGYQKKNQAGKGGVLRVSTAPELKIIDNINLDGVPQTIFVK
ncbi:hypothetical protein BTR34_18175 [Maribacter hydrothermalis]|nr:hypothetical protein BTR34_18175 [Maribacter hydrothermalis]